MGVLVELQGGIGRIPHCMVDSIRGKGFKMQETILNTSSEPCVWFGFEK